MNLARIIMMMGLAGLLACQGGDRSNGRRDNNSGGIVELPPPPGDENDINGGDATGDSNQGGDATGGDSTPGDPGPETTSCGAVVTEPQSLGVAWSDISAITREDCDLYVLRNGTPSTVYRVDTGSWEWEEAFQWDDPIVDIVASPTGIFWIDSATSNIFTTGYGEFAPEIEVPFDSTQGNPYELETYFGYLIYLADSDGTFGVYGQNTLGGAPVVLTAYTSTNPITHLSKGSNLVFWYEHPTAASATDGKILNTFYTLEYPAGASDDSRPAGVVLTVGDSYIWWTQPDGDYSAVWGAAGADSGGQMLDDGLTPMGEIAAYEDAAYLLANDGSTIYDVRFPNPVNALPFAEALNNAHLLSVDEDLVFWLEATESAGEVDLWRAPRNE